MKVEKIRVGISELRKTEDFENRRFTIEVEAAPEIGETSIIVQESLIKRVRDAVDKFFEEEENGEESVSRLKRKLRKYHERYGECV